MMKKIIVFGTTPEAIKMILLNKFKEFSELFNTKFCFTAQCRKMLDQVMRFFEIKPDDYLNMIKADHDLLLLNSEVISQMKYVLKEFSPNYIYVHGGDTTTALSAANVRLNPYSDGIASQRIVIYS